MQEFGAMCKERDTEVIKGVLPYWPRIYCKISQDHDRRVREATQQAFEQLVLKIKRNLAPYLKSIMGCWLIAQCDTFTPAASAAKVAFQVAFPPNKQPEALAFCKEEVLSVLQDNLLKETPETLSDLQTVPEEEREAKYLRVVTSSLLALKKLLCILPDSENSSIEERVVHLVSQNKFWKYSKHKSPQVRAAFFELIATLCQYLPGSLRAEAGRVCPAVLLSIDDGDAAVSAALWEAALHILTTVEDCWNHVNARKGVLPKLWTVLREGGRGLATVVYPNLLPFVSKIPQEVIDPQIEFFSNFFTSIIKGFSSERALVSSSECSAIVSAVMECLRYTLLQNAGEEKEQRSIQQMLINKQLLPLVDSALKDSKLQNSPLFYQLADTLSSWEKRVDASGEAPTTDTFRRALSDFWEGFSQLCILQVDRVEPEEKSLSAVSHFLQVLQNPDSTGKQSRKKHMKIRFAEEEADGENMDVSIDLHVEAKTEGEAKMSVDPPVLQSSSSPQLSELRTRPLQNLVCKLAELSMVHINRHSLDKHLKFLSALVSSFPSSKVFQVLLACSEQISTSGVEMSEGGKAMSENAAVQFLHQKLLVWLKEDHRKDTAFLVDVLYSVLHCCNDDSERKIILEHLSQMELKWIIFLQIIQKACFDPAKYSLVSSWLKGEILGEKLVRLADELCVVSLEQASPVKPSHSDSWSLLSLVLSQHAKNDALIGEVYVEQILNKLHAALSKAKDLSAAGSIEPPVSFICDVTSSFFSSVKGCLLLPSAEDLLLTLFQLCAQRPEKDYLSVYLFCKLQHTWLCGVSSLVNQHSGVKAESSFLQKSALWVKDQIQHSSLDVKRIVQVISLFMRMLSNNPASFDLCAWQERRSCAGRETFFFFTKDISTLYWLYKPLLDGRLNLNHGPSFPQDEFCSCSRVPSHLCTTALLGQVALLTNGTEGFSEDVGRIETKNIVAELLYSLQWCEELENPSSVLSEYGGMLQELGITHERIRNLSNLFSDVLEELYRRSKEGGLLWSLTASKYIATTEGKSSKIKPLYDLVEGFFPLTDAKLHTIQSLSSFMPVEDKDDLMAICTAKLMTCVNTDLSSIDGRYGFLVIINCCLNSGTKHCPEILSEILKTIMCWRNDIEGLFLFNCNLKEAASHLLGLNVEIIRFLQWLVKHSLSSLMHNEWDFLLCSLLAWLETACDEVTMYCSPLVQLFTCASCDLVSELATFFQTEALSLKEQLPENLLSEWQEFFAQGIYSLFLPLLMKSTGECEGPSAPVSVLRALGRALAFIPLDQLMNHNLPPKFVAGQKTNLPDRLQTLMNTLAPLLFGRARSVQVTVYHILHSPLEDCVLGGGREKIRRNHATRDWLPPPSPPAALMAILGTQEELLGIFLDSVPVGEFAAVQPLSEEYCYVLGYLLTWKLILAFFKAAPSQLRVLYSQHLRKKKSLHKLLQHLFRLMPENPVFPGQAIEPGVKEAKTFFMEDLHLTVQETASLSSEIPHLACCVYYSTLKDMPAMVRLWWNSQDKRISSAVDKFTNKYISSRLSSQEITSVQTSTQTFESMMVSGLLYIFYLLKSYHICTDCVSRNQQLGGRKFPLQIRFLLLPSGFGQVLKKWGKKGKRNTVYLSFQNGSIIEGLALWKNNVDKRFEGVEDCMICFSVIHGSNYSLPKKACRTCKKKFHSACLYKWFTSSNKSTCPLCRESFF
uniref:E3 ubiquitin-protein ligase listerin n=1 Tax=Latimeria chalumnae TaxID=7897 RepID=H3AL29_LATCH